MSDSGTSNSSSCAGGGSTDSKSTCWNPNILREWICDAEANGYLLEAFSDREVEDQRKRLAAMSESSLRYKSEKEWLEVLEEFAGNYKSAIKGLEVFIRAKNESDPEFLINLEKILTPSADDVYYLEIPKHLYHPPHIKVLVAENPKQKELLEIRPRNIKYIEWILKRTMLKISNASGCDDLDELSGHIQSLKAEITQLKSKSKNKESSEYFKEKQLKLVRLEKLLVESKSIVEYQMPKLIAEEAFLSELRTKYQVSEGSVQPESTPGITQAIKDFCERVDEYCLMDFYELDEAIVQLWNQCYHQNRDKRGDTEWALDTSKLWDKYRKFFQLPSNTIQSGKLVTGICNEDAATWSKAAIQYPLKPCPLKLALATRDSVFGLLAGIDIEDFKQLLLSEQLKLDNSIDKLTRKDSERYYGGYSNEFRKFIGIEPRTSFWKPFDVLVSSYRTDDSKDQELATLHDRLPRLIRSIVPVVQQISEIGKFEFPCSSESMRSMTVSRLLIMIRMLGLGLKEEFEQIPKILGLSDSQSRYCFDRMTLGDLLWLLEISKHPIKKPEEYGSMLRPTIKLILSMIFDKTPETLTQFSRPSSEKSSQILRYMIENDFISTDDRDLDGETVFQKACSQSYRGSGRELIELCMKRGADLNERDEEGLTQFERTIVTQGDWKLLRELGASIKYYHDTTIFHWLVENQHIWKKAIKDDYMRYLKSTLFEELWETVEESQRKHLCDDKMLYECPEIPKHLVYRSRGKKCDCRYNSYDGVRMCSGCEYWG